MRDYAIWIKSSPYSTFDGSLAKCIEACAEMQRVFPELEERNGVVFSKDNPDDYSSKYPKEYPHRWLVTPEGEIIDPTIEQFRLIGKVEYREIDRRCAVNKCMGCGTWFNGLSGYCGKCEWSE